MVSRPAGVLRLGRREFEPWRLLVMGVVGPARDPGLAMERVHAVVAEGADIVEVSGRTELIVPFVAAVRDAYPELVIGVSTGRREVAREACAAGADLLGGPQGPEGSGLWLGEVAAEPGVGVAGSLSLAAAAVAAGVEPQRVVVDAGRPVRRLAELVATGWPVLVAPPEEDGAGSLAATAIAAWLGARVFRVGRVRETRRVLSMVSAIRGDIPPAYAVRGLALDRQPAALTGDRRRRGTWCAAVDGLLLTMSIKAIARRGPAGPAAQSCLTGRLAWLN